ncbi:MAG TPA: hypothetical protein VM662_16680 [Sphingomonas sp.]|nr:hypothetical protein [Sphingomonas sp.]
MTPAEERLAEALLVERQHGDRAPAFAAERIGELAAAGDAEGVKRWTEIAVILDGLRRPAGPLN